MRRRCHLAHHLVATEEDGRPAGRARAFGRDGLRRSGSGSGGHLVDPTRAHLLAHLARRLVQRQRLEAPEELRQRLHPLRRVVVDLLERARSALDLAVPGEEAPQREVLLGALRRPANRGLQRARAVGRPPRLLEARRRAHGVAPRHERGRGVEVRADALEQSPRVPGEAARAEVHRGGEGDLPRRLRHERVQRLRAERLVPRESGEVGRAPRLSARERVTRGPGEIAGFLELAREARVIFRARGACRRRRSRRHGEGDCRAVVLACNVTPATTDTSNRTSPESTPGT